MPEIVHYSEGRLITDGGQNVPDSALTQSGTSATLAGDNTFTGDVKFKSGRPWYDPVAFGADPSGATDSNAAFTAMINAINAAGVRGKTVALGIGFFKIYGTLPQLTVQTNIRGAGTHTSSTRAATVVWMATIGAAGFSFGANTAKSTLEQFFLLGSATTGLGTDDGVASLARLQLRDVTIQGFGRHGVNLDTTTTGNCDNSVLDNVRSTTNFGDGFHFVGPNSNCINLDGSCSATFNGGYGLYNGSGTQHNRALGIHFDSNTLGPVYDNGESHCYQDVYDEHAGVAVLDTASTRSTWHLGGGTAVPTVLNLAGGGTNGHTVWRAGQLLTPLTVSVGPAANLISATRQYMRTGSSGFYSAQANSSIAVDGAITIDGYNTARMTSLAAGTMYSDTGFITGIVPRRSYTLSAKWLAGQAQTENVRIEAEWYDAAGTLITSGSGSYVADDPTTPVVTTFTQVAPAAAAQLRVNFRAQTTAGIGEVHAYSEVSVVPTTTPAITIDPLAQTVTTADGTLLTFAGVRTTTTVTVRKAQSLASAGAVAIDASQGDAVITLGANATSSSITNPIIDQQLRITFVQDATGGRTYVYPTNCRFAGGAAPTDTTASKRTSVTFVYDGTNWNEVSRAVAVG